MKKEPQFQQGDFFEIAGVDQKSWRIMLLKKISKSWLYVRIINGSINEATDEKKINLAFGTVFLGQLETAERIDKITQLELALRAIMLEGGYEVTVALTALCQFDPDEKN